MLPPLWKRHARVALISPAGATKPEVLTECLSRLEQLGITAIPSAHLRARKRFYLAGSVEERLEDLYAAFEHDDIDAVWCLRGGYGAAQLLEQIDWQRLQRARSIPLIGYSDITALLAAFERHGLKAIHGPVASEVTKLNLGLAPEQLMTTSRWQSLASIGEVLDHPNGFLPLQETSVSLHGSLLGGNLTVLTTLCGTPSAFQPDTDYILVIEDVSEPYYCLERCFYQLLASLNHQYIKAVCIGEFDDCTPPDEHVRVEELFQEWLDKAGIPLLTGLPIGHGENNRAWHYGASASLTDNGIEWAADMHETTNRL